MRRWLLLSLVLASASAASADDDVPDWVRPRGRVVVTSTSCTILGPITFASGVSTISPEHAEILDATAETMLGNPSIEQLAVQTFGDPIIEGDEQELEAAQDLADARAQLVVMYLASRGVEPWRLVPEGSGVRQDSEDGRVKFLILRRTP